MKALCRALLVGLVGFLLGRELTLRRWRAAYLRLQVIAARNLESLSTPR